jgi:tetratricopeptide (TPR) repeat protein
LAAGRELGVDMVVDGQLQTMGDNVKLTVRLSSVRTRSLMWTATFDEKLDNISAVEDIIALRISRTLSPALTKGGGVALPERYTSSAEAYQAYLNGLYFWDKRSTDGFERSIPYFEQAIATDPNFAPAYALLADAGAVVGKIPQPEGETLIRKAIELDGAIGEPHASLGFLKMFFQWKWDEGQQEFKRCTELSPNFATGHQWYAISLAVRGRLAEALGEMKQARELDPLSAPIAADMGQMYYFAREYDLAIEEFRKALDLDPGFVIANGGLSNAYSQKGMYKEAVEHYLRGLDPPETVKSLRGAFEKSGWRGFLEQTLERERVALNTYETAKAYSRLGEKEQALKWLEQAYERRDFMLYLVKIDPDFDALHSDPRFEEIIRGMGL